jgi:hypothetical protein
MIPLGKIGFAEKIPLGKIGFARASPARQNAKIFMAKTIILSLMVNSVKLSH